MNNYAKALSITGWIVLVAGIIGSFVLGDQLRVDRWSYNTGVCIAGILTSVIFGLLLLGFGEVISILDDNRKYLKKLAQSEPEQEPKGSDELPDL